jgi:hypothetical protein
MKNYIFILAALCLSSCIKNETNSTSHTMTPCTISNQGIFVSSQPSPNGASSKVNTFQIDSVVLKTNKFTLWFTEDGSNEKLIATLTRYDNGTIQSG